VVAALGLHEFLPSNKGAINDITTYHNSCDVGVCLLMTSIGDIQAD
jgi:hypothetical protein